MWDSTAGSKPWHVDGSCRLAFPGGLGIYSIYSDPERLSHNYYWPQMYPV